MSGDRRGFEIFSRRVGPGAWYPHHPPSYDGVRARTQPKLRKVMETGTSVPTHLGNIQTCSGESLKACMFVDSFCQIDKTS